LPFPHWFSVLLAIVVDGLSPWTMPTLSRAFIGCITPAAFVVANTQDGIARSHDWMRLGLNATVHRAASH